jgi:acyl carrier protein
MRDRVLKISSQVLNVPLEQLHDESSPDTIANWDSLKHMNLILAIEEEFSVAFSDNEVAGMQNVGSIVETLGRRTQQRNSMQR